MGDPEWFARPDEHGMADVGYEDENGQFIYIAEVNDARNASVLAAAPNLYRELEEVEWSGSLRGECPCCGNGRPFGHIPTCTLAAALGKANPDE